MTQTLYEQAVKVVRSSQRTDYSFVSRQLGIEYDAAADLVRRMEKEGVVSAENGQGKRQVMAETIKSKAISAATEAAMGVNSKANGPDILNMNDQLTETARDKLRLTIERIERLEEERKEVSEQIKEVKAEAKALGFDVKAINAVVRLRKQDRDERAAHEAVLETYLDALGEL